MVARWRKETTWTAGQAFKTFLEGEGGISVASKVACKTNEKQNDINHLYCLVAIGSATIL